MLTKKKFSDVTGTVIGEGVRLKSALLSGNDSVRIDGIFEGDIRISGSLILGETGVIEGDLSAKHALIAGRITGNVFCGTTVHITATAVINGNVEAQAFVVDEGAVFNGNCKMGEFKVEEYQEADMVI